MHRPEITQYIKGGKQLSEAEEKELLMNRISDYYRHPGLGVWAICLQSTGELIGSINLNPIKAEPEHDGKTHLGFRIAVPHWRQGYAYEAASAMIEYASEKVNIEVVTAFSDQRNISSINLLKKLGFNEVGATKIYSTDGLEFNLDLT